MMRGSRTSSTICPNAAGQSPGAPVSGAVRIAITVRAGTATRPRPSENTASAASAMTRPAVTVAKRVMRGEAVTESGAAISIRRYG
ncbi:hypothetical protein [Albidovulum sp.]